MAVKKIRLLLLSLLINTISFTMNALDPIHAKKYVLIQHIRSNLLQELIFRGARQGEVKLILDALERNAPLDIQNSQGRTPLIEAVAANHTQAAKSLLLAGAKTETRDNQGNTAEDYATRNNNNELLTLLKK